MASSEVEEQQSINPVGSGWVGGWRVGKGSYGTVSIFVRQNARGLIEDRLVVKDTTIRNYTTNPEEWFLDGEDLYPMEVHALLALNKRPDSENIIKLRGWRWKTGEIEFQEKPASLFRQHLPFLPHGDLWNLRIHRHPRARGSPPQLPEPFIWSVADCLATAGVLMVQGTTDAVAARPHDWRPIIHSDIKLPNVMLDVASEHKHRGYPKVVLVDFGLCVYMLEGQDCWPRGGTPCTEAPEIAWNLFDNNGTRLPRSTKTDVWAFGCILWSLLHGYDGSPQQNYRDVIPQGQEAPPPIFRQYAISHTTNELRDMITRCMQHNPRNRPSFADLLTDIRTHTSRKPKNYDYSVRDAPGDSPLWNMVRVKGLNEQPDDRWPLWSELKDAAPLPDGKAFPWPPTKDLSPVMPLTPGFGSAPSETSTSVAETGRARSRSTSPPPGSAMPAKGKRKRRLEEEEDEEYTPPVARARRRK